MNSLGFYRLLLNAHLRMAWRRLSSVREQSRLMVAVIGIFVATYWVAGYALFHWGFVALSRVPGLGVILVDRMLYLFFAFLFVMLVFSNIIIGYSTLFKSYETQWMLTLPVRAVDVFRWKLVETAILASWAFLFLSAPLLLAYGAVRKLTLLFYLKMFLLFIPFTAIPATLGLLVIMFITRYLHRRVFKWALFGVGTLVVIGAVFFLKPVEAGRLQEAQLMAALNQLLHNSRITVQPILPSYWVASSMIAWSQGWTWKGTFFFLVLLSNAMMATLVCLSASGSLFYDGWSRNHSQGRLRTGVALLDKEIALRTGFVERLVHWLPVMGQETRALVLKDIRVFWRDTTQWSQFVIFFGLLGLYVLNLRNVAYDSNNQFWARFVSFLNLGASSMTLATLTTRFVFPQFSLEGKRLWMIGMAPYGLRRVVLEKFWLSSTFSILITLTLALLSSWMLRLPLWLTLLFGATVILMSFALCGIAVGSGVLFPNFGSGSTANRRDDNSAKIVSGFGGTFCFLLSLVYIVIVIGAEAIPMYMEIGDIDPAFLIVGSWIFVSLLSFGAAWLPMRLALKRVEAFEI